MDEELQLVAFQIIAAGGSARGMYVQAFELARQGRYEEAEESIRQGDALFLQGHDAHTAVLQKVASGEPLAVDILLVHAEDQMAAAETCKLMAEELIELNKKIDKIDAA